MAQSTVKRKEKGAKAANGKFEASQRKNSLHKGEKITYLSNKADILHGSKAV